MLTRSVIEPDGVSNLCANSESKNGWEAHRKENTGTSGTRKSPRMNKEDEDLEEDSDNNSSNESSDSESEDLSDKPLRRSPRFNQDIVSRSETILEDPKVKEVNHLDTNE